MEKFEKHYKDFFENIEMNPNLKGVVMNKVEKAKKAYIIKKRIAFALAILVVGFFALSFVAPVFGKAGTLPQLLKGIKVENNARDFVGVINVDETILQKVEASNLPFEDAVVIFALSKDQNVDIDKVIALRSEGYGWGKILDTLKKDTTIIENTLKESSISKNEVAKTEDANATQNLQKETEQNQNRTTTENSGTNTTLQNQEQEKEQEQNQIQVIVIKGNIENLSTNEIVVDGETITINQDTSIKYLGKPFDITKLTKDTPVLVHAEMVNGSLIAKDIIVFKINDNSNKDKSNEENQTSNENKGTDESENKGTDESENVNKEKEFELNTTILSIQNGVITLKDFNYPVLITDTTKIEITHEGRVSIESLKEGQNVQIHIRNDNGNYIATNIVVKEEKGNLDEEKGNTDTNKNKEEKKP